MTDLRAPDTLEPAHGWLKDARCVGVISDAFLADGGPDAVWASSVCKVCPVALTCLEEAMATETGDYSHRAGVRGGLTPRQRSSLANQLRAAARQGPAQTEPRKGGKPAAPCGTPGGYDRHQRNKEPADEACLAAHRAKNQEQRAKARRDREPVVCGTRVGYQKHRRDGEETCDPCRYANAAAGRRLRSTGTTKVLA